ncbi:hypothetical protein [Leptolyngbya sp. PCC 6406]|uniref:hypothetical protein n=1 Tax=Leptolyngbya sp. PCC 6406 TaxID=1173264 RepID=UPI0002FA620A|nr:hypothetical protein [Leptolyngbya sp. PCC 6406]
MSNASQPVSSRPSQHRTQLELLHAVLEAEGLYPWQPHAPQNRAYFDALEATVDGEDLSSTDLQRHWRTLSQQASQLWNTGADSLATLLAGQFGNRMPAGILAQLATQVKAAANQSGSLLDQLVMAVEDVLTQWDVDDLRVIARPLALAMRDGHGDVVEATIQSTGTADWADLSDLEKARLGLAIARYAFDHLDA